MERLLDLVTGRDPGVTLDHAALELAAIEFPGLDIGASVALLDSFAAELETRLGASRDGDAYIREANRFLFDALGFKGNSDDYYDPRNSCLNHVLAVRTGLPITLSVLYMEIGRRLKRPIYGIGLPGHFIVRYDDGVHCAYIDPFNGGRILQPGECIAAAREASGLDLKPDPRLLDPVSKAQIVMRMIHNLQNAYLARGLAAKAIEVADLLIHISPDPRKSTGTGER